MSPSKLAARVVLGYVGLVEGAAALIRFRERTAAFQAATERATALGRLVVVGDPDAGTVGLLCGLGLGLGLRLRRRELSARP